MTPEQERKEKCFFICVWSGYVNGKPLSGRKTFAMGEREKLGVWFRKMLDRAMLAYERTNSSGSHPAIEVYQRGWRYDDEGNRTELGNAAFLTTDF